VLGAGASGGMSTEDACLPATSEAWSSLSRVRLMRNRLAHEQVQPPLQYRRVA
jgi:hypothetical protein